MAIFHSYVNVYQRVPPANHHIDLENETLVESHLHFWWIIRILLLKTCMVQGDATQLELGL